MSQSVAVEPLFFAGPEEFYGWLEAHHAHDSELWVGYYKKATGKQTMSWSQAVDQALCFGWIDGVLRRIDDETHMQRFTPRKPGSNWSKVNVEKMARLEAEGLVAPAGRRAFEARRADRTGIYSFERDEPAQFPSDFAARLQANAAASDYFENRAPSYRRTCIHWVTSAKREETRVRRMDQLIACSERGLDVPQFRRRP
ncbi:MAG: YdeI/OmpD-associated family protein [Thermoleophilaceae bacterium]|nr:YdeI/OmpD-associated family protein [Thermoleophilaceae bacterium]